MIKQSITYEDFDGNQVTEEHYFHLSKSELIDMETSPDGAMSERLQRIGTSSSGAEIIKMFKEIIAASYGQRVDGSGSKFFKSQSMTDEFMGSLAFDTFLTTLLTDPRAAIVFANGVMPKDLAATAEVQAALKADLAAVQDVALPAPGRDVIECGLSNPFDSEGVVLPWAFREPTNAEMRAMTQTQLLDVYDRKNKGWKPPPEA